MRILKITLILLVAIFSLPIKGQAQMPVGTNFWFIYPNGEQPWKDNVDFTTVDDPWDTVYLSRLKPYNLLRFMDWGGTNASTQVQWSDRTLKRDPIQPGGWHENGIAYEWMIDLGNKLQKDIWICVPHMADSNYIGQLAQLIYNELNPGLKCYIEYSNETWNDGFEQALYSTQQGTAMGWNEGTNGDIKARLKWHNYMASKIFSIFALVFDDEMDDRIVKTISGWHGWTDMAIFQINTIMDTEVNPEGIVPDYFCTAPYVGHDLEGADFKGFRKEINEVAFKAGQIKTALNSLNPAIKFGTYEGGQHILTDPIAFSSNRESYFVYIEMLRAMSDYFDLFVHYAHSGGWGDNGAWGSMLSKTQAIEDAHKYRALTDWINNTIEEKPTGLSVPNKKILLYPNPATKHINISMSGISNKDFMSVTSLTGKTMQVYSSIQNDHIFLDLNETPPGIYFVNLRKGPEFIIKKFIKKN